MTSRVFSAACIPDKKVIYSLSRKTKKTQALKRGDLLYEEAFCVY